MSRGVVFALLLLVIASTSSYARTLSGSDEVKNDQVCTLCEQFVAQAFDYLAENKTQTEVVEYLHSACSRLASLKKQLSSIQPEDFCKKVNLCQEFSIISTEIREDTCGICHRAMSEIFLKLKDPDTQLEIIELLLKGCNSMDNYAQKCKKMVFEYGPVVLANAEQFLETKDLCVLLHACTPTARTEVESEQLKADS